MPDPYPCRLPGRAPALGHIAIGHVTGPNRISVTTEREQAFRAALRAEGLPAGRERVVRAGNHAAGEVAETAGGRRPAAGAGPHR